MLGTGGSSNTLNASGYVKKLEDGAPQYSVTRLNTSYNGYCLFPSLVNFPVTTTADQIVFDTSGDVSMIDVSVIEAYIRLTKTRGNKLMVIPLPYWTIVDNGQVNTPANQAVLTSIISLLNTYGIAYFNMWAYCQAYVSSGGNLSALYSDYIHLSTQGQQAVADGLKNDFITGGIIPALPARVHVESADYEIAPVIKLGTDYDSKTGTWSEVGTQISSVTAGSTVTYSGTFRRFGVYRADNLANINEFSIDGGAFSGYSTHPNGVDLGSRAAHIIVIKVTTDTVIDEFWAI